VISAEYTTGTIRATFSAAPNRLRVFGAKIVVFGVLSFVRRRSDVVRAFFLGSSSCLGPRTRRSGPALFGGGFRGWPFRRRLDFSPGVGTIIRHTRSISAFVAVLLVLPISPRLCRRQLRRTSQVMPDRSGRHAHDEGQDFGAFSPWVGLFIICGLRWYFSQLALNVGKTGRLIFCSDEDLTSVERKVLRCHFSVLVHR